MVYLKLNHEYFNDVQTMVQAFYPNRHYVLTEDITDEGICIESYVLDNKCSAKVYIDGAIICFKEAGVNNADVKTAIKTSIYKSLGEVNPTDMPWGILTGIRPAKLALDNLRLGMTDDDVATVFEDKYFVSKDKARLCLEVAHARDNMPKAEGIGVYIGIPFCPTRCSYCSFSSYPMTAYNHLVEDYVQALMKEITYAGKRQTKCISTLYIGGGTPTSLDERQLFLLLGTIEKAFDISGCMEYTVEAGRPDSITTEKLRLMKEFGVNRISVNPQTMNNKTLRIIGRNHTADDTQSIFFKAREMGFDNINMDTILGLPGESEKTVENTFNAINALSPEGITVHTLAIKRASRLKEELDGFEGATPKTIENMLRIADGSVRGMGLKPYYMYRQKNMLGNFENVGYAISGKECLYNVQIMEETHSILALGAGAVTKTVDNSTGRIERIFNVKNVEEYIKRGVDEAKYEKWRLL